MIKTRRPNVLYLAHRVPYPPNRGDRIRSFHTLQFLSQYADVCLGCLSDEAVEPEAVEHLQQLVSRVAIVPLRDKARWVRGAASLLCGRTVTEGMFASRQLTRIVATWNLEKKFDAILVFCSSMFQYLDLPDLKEIPAIVDLVDVDSQKFFDYAAHTCGWKKWLYELEGRRLRRVECELPKRAKAITLVSEAEADLYRSFCPNDRTLAIPNGVDIDYFRPENDGSHPWRPLPESERTNLVFVGALDYHANVDGIRWYSQEVWPQVRHELPHVTLGLVGRNPVPAIRKLESIPGIRIFGTVPDVRPYLAAADIAIAPLRIARGIQNKVLEAMAMAKPVLCTPAALEGIGARVGRDVLIAGSPREWVASIHALESSHRRAKVGESAREYVSRCHTWNSNLDVFRSAISGLTMRLSELPKPAVL